MLHTPSDGLHRLGEEFRAEDWEGLVDLERTREGSVEGCVPRSIVCRRLRGPIGLAP